MLEPAPLPLGVVRFRDVDGDQAVFVPSQDRRTVGRPLGRIGEEIEGEALRSSGRFESGSSNS